MSVYFANVYRSVSAGDCTNGGITRDGGPNIVVVLTESEPVTELLRKCGRPLMMLDRRGGRLPAVVRPLDAPPGIMSPSAGMFGGNFVWSCESRFRQEVGEFPVAAHDRFEGYLHRVNARRGAERAWGPTAIVIGGEYDGFEFKLTGDNLPVHGESFLGEFRDGENLIWVASGVLR